MLITITVNQNGSIGIWLDIPERLTNRWSGKFAYTNILVYKKIKKLVEEANMTWISEPLTIPIPL